MTLIIGILCDSASLSGDGAATLAAPHTPTICQNNCKKLYSIDDKISSLHLVIRLAQRLKGVVDGFGLKGFRQKKPTQITVLLLEQWIC